MKNESDPNGISSSMHGNHAEKVIELYMNDRDCNSGYHSSNVVNYSHEKQLIAKFPENFIFPVHYLQKQK